jgi:hypothetical protein
MRFGAVAGSMLALTVAGAAADPESTSETTPPAAVSSDAELESLTVEGRRAIVTRQVSQFVSSVAMPASHESLARWQLPICIVVVGLPPPETDFVTQRIARVAEDAGVPVSPQGCGPNFLVIVTSEPETLLKEWWAADHGLFNRERGIGGVKRLIRTPRAVRVWHNVCNAPPGIARNFQMRGSPLCGKGQVGSRLTWDAVRSIYSVIQVVDLEHIVGLTYGQVADYVAMVGLAQVRENPELGNASTILGLFAQVGADKPHSLSPFDQAFLKSLYETTDGSKTEVAQIKVRMGQDLLR